jgi:hypothetical protein
VISAPFLTFSPSPLIATYAAARFGSFVTSLPSLKPLGWPSFSTIDGTLLGSFSAVPLASVPTLPTMSNRKTIVSSFFTPRVCSACVWAWPSLKPSFGGIATSTRLPTFWPVSPLTKPASTLSVDSFVVSGRSALKELSNCLPVRPLTAT